MNLFGRVLASKNIAKCSLLVCVVFVFGVQPAVAQPGLFGRMTGPDPDDVAWREAHRLADSGKTEAAFLKYLTLPGAEAAALKIGRLQAKAFLALLKDSADAIPAVRRRLVEADLMLALQDRDAALVGYQDVAQQIAKNGDQGWEDGLLPQDQYFVEPTAHRTPYGGRQIPFTAGPGSHRDNLLIRRFIALEAWKDARREFERVWQLHTAALQPYVVRMQTHGPEGPSQDLRRHIVNPVSYNSHGLLFALDYAYFLQRQDDDKAARDVLLAALLRIDRERNPDRINYGKPVLDTEGLDLAERSLRLAPNSGTGVSVREYIRLAYGALKAQGDEAALVDQLTDRIAAGQNRLRRVLAQVRLHQGQTEAAQQLELDYLAEAKLNPLDTAVRRGQVFYAAQQRQDALREYEIAWNLLQGDDLTAAAKKAVPYSSANGIIPVHIARWNVLSRLERLYAELGRVDDSLEVARQQVTPTRPSNAIFSEMEGLRQKHQKAGQSQVLTVWAKQQLAGCEDDNFRANLYWLLGDHQAAAESFAKLQPFYDAQGWKQRFQAVGRQQYRSLLQAIIAENPKDTQTRFELLELDGTADDLQGVERLELLLESDARWLFQRGKGSGNRNRTEFKDYFEIAYPLIRIYERTEQFDKLHALALRIARSEKPFTTTDYANYAYRDANGIPERANGALAIAIQHANTKRERQELKAALAESVWQAANAQLLRRMAPNDRPSHAAVPWANLPGGVELIASTENVLTLAHDKRYVYSGHPWGVAVYDYAGEPVIRIALGEAARAMVVSNDRLWVGTPKGLFRISPDDWSVAHQWLHGDLQTQGRHSNSFPGPQRYWFDNSVYSLAADGDELWIGLHRNVQRLNMKTLDLRAFSFDELKIKSWAGYEKIVIDGRYVWADSRHSGVRRYDRTTDEWSSFGQSDSRYPVRFVTIIDGQVIGNIYVDDELRNRLCLIDRDTLAVETIPLESNSGQQLINSVLRPFGKCAGQRLFGAESPAYALDEATLTLRPIPAAVEKVLQQLRSQRVSEKTHPATAGAVNNLAQLKLIGATMQNASSAAAQHMILPNGTLVLGARQGRIEYAYPTRDRPVSSASAQREVKDHTGGLYFVTQHSNGSAVDTDAAPVATTVPIIRRVSSVPRTNSIRGDLVRTVVFGDKQSWLCTSAGVAQFDEKQRVQRWFSRMDGLCANRVTSGAELFGKTYFSTSWGDSGGGLAVFDPQTEVFTLIAREDGLPTEKLESVSVDGDRLLLTFGEEYMRHNSSGGTRYQQFPQASYDPKSNTIGPIGKLRSTRQNDLHENRRNVKRELVPILGGTLSERLEHNGRIYLCGTRGLVISKPQAVEPQFAELGATLRETPAARQLADAASRKVVIKNPQELAVALQDENPFYRANAIASLNRLQRPYSDGFLPLLASQLEEPNSRLRATAFYFVQFYSNDEQVIPLLKARLEDTDSAVRALAILELARRGQLTDTRQLQVLSYARLSGYPFAARSSIGVDFSASQVCAAIAPHATPEVFEWLLKKSPKFNNGDLAKSVFPDLAKSLRRHPQAIDVLLKARVTRRQGTSLHEFVRNVFLHVGPAALPMLHKALRSDDRIVRSNAARVCGAIKDESSIQPLLQAVDLESGLSRASIVWALGELKAKSSLPVLVSLYASAQANEQRANAANRYGGQQAVAGRPRSVRISHLESLAEDWGQLTVSVLSPMIDDIAQEEVLLPQHILDAVRKIGPEYSQDFYRALASSKDATARATAAKQLVGGLSVDRDRNVAVLKRLLVDDVASVRVVAAVGLIGLQDVSGQAVILDLLNSNDSRQLRRTLAAVATIGDAAQLSFCRDRIEAIANDATLDAFTRRAASGLLP